MPISFSALTLIGSLTLSLFLGILNFWFWRAQREDRTPIWIGAWLSASAIFTFCHLLQYASLSESMYILVPRILLSAAYSLAWLGYEIGNSFIDYHPPRWERTLIILLTALPVMFLWMGNLVLTDQTVVRAVAFGGEFTGVQTGSLYLPVSILILVIGAIPIVRLMRVSDVHKRESRLMAAGLAFIILFSLSDFIATAFGQVWIRFSDFSYLPVAILFNYIQVQRFGRLYREMDILVQERTTDLSQANEALRAEIKERKRAETEILNRTQMMTVLYETTSDLIIEHDLSKLLRIIVERATELLRAGGGGLYLCEPEESLVRCVVSYNTPRDFTGTVLKFGEGAAGRVAQTGKSLIIHDYSTWIGKAKAYEGETALKAVLCVPIKWQDRIIGMLNVEEYSKERLYTEEDEKLASSFANQAAIAIQNTRLYDQFRQELTERKQIQDALLESRTQLSGIIETAMDGIITVDEDQHILLFNAASEKMFHCSAEEAIGQSIDRFIPDRFREVHREHIRRFAQTGETKRAMGPQLDLVGLRADGEEFPIEASISQIEVAGKKIYTVIHRDITLRKQAEEALLEAEQKYRSIFENVVEGVHQTTPEGRYLAANQATANMLGYDSPDELIASMTDLDHQFYVDPNRRAQFKQALEKSDTITNFESQVYRKDGSTIWVSENGRAVRDENGRLLYYDGTSQDITERKRAEAALRESEEKYRTTVENANDGITIIQHGVVKYVNPKLAEMRGEEISEIIGQRFAKFVHPDKRSKIFDYYRQQLAGENTPTTYETVLVRKDNSKVLAELTTGLINYEDAEAEIVIVRDITERKQAEEALKESETRFSTAFFTNPVSQSIITQENNEIMAVNDACCRLFGYSREELLGASTAKLSLWENPNDRLAAVEEIQRTGHLLPREATVRVKSGEIRTVIVAIEPINWKGIPCFISSIFDITERKKAENALQESEEKFRKAFMTSPDSIHINRIADGLFIDINEGFTSLTGYTTEDVKDKTSLEINIWADPADRVRLIQGLQEYREIANMEASFRLKDGSIRVGLLSARIIQVEGETCILSITRDITELKRAEEEIRFRANQMVALAEVSRDISSTLDFDVVLERIALYAKDLLRAETSAVYLYKPAESNLQAIAVIGFDAEEIKQELLNINEGILGNIARSKVGEIVNNNANDSRAIAIKGTEKNPDEHLMGVPVLVEDRLTGLIAVWRSGVGNEFFPSELEFLENLALQVAVAIENARLFENTRQRLSEIEAVQTVSTALRSAKNLEEALPIILDQVANLMKAGSVLVDLLDESSGEIVTELALGVWTPMIGKRTPKGAGGSGYVISTGQPYISVDLMANGTVAYPELLGGINSGACVPIIAQHQPIGTLWVGRNTPITGVEVSLLEAIGEMVGNAIHRMMLHEQTEHRANKLASLRKIDQAITANVNLADILDVVLDQVQTRLNVHAADILLLTPKTQNLDYKLGRGFRLEAFERAHRQICEEFSKRVARELYPVHITDLTDIKDNHNCAKFLNDEGFVAYFGFPLIVKEQLVGVLEFYQRSPFNIDEEWTNFMEALAGQTAIAIEKAQILDDLQTANLDLIQAYDTTLEGWAKALELRDRETEGHSRRVTNLTLELARRIGMSESELIHVHRGVLLHDIGKMGIPDRILNKTGPLNDDEWGEMREHPQYAYDLLLPIAYLRPALDIPYCHHERWDGSGYPRGLKGEKIPLAARVFAVVDVWDALVNDRPYRNAWTEKKTIDYIKEQSGILFDPQVVDVFLEIQGKA